MMSSNNKYAAFFIIILAFGFTGLSAQDLVTASGGEGAGDEGLISYSVGQIVYTYNSGEGGEVFQGVQLPFEISVINDLYETEYIDLDASVYPNPTNNIIILKKEIVTTSELHYKLYGITGELIENKIITNRITPINMRNYDSGLYIIRVFEKGHEIKSFKIIKK